MRYTFPDYYREFSCIADRCEDTCCAGWQIVADRKALRRYREAARKDGRAPREKRKVVRRSGRAPGEDLEELQRSGRAPGEDLEELRRSSQAPGEDLEVARRSGRAPRKDREVSEAFRKRLVRSVHWRNGTFRRDKEGRCAFLNKENLCDMYIALGSDGLCRTCRLYPRHVEEFENIREVTLSISCPEVAAILLNRTEPVRFIALEKPGEEEYPSFDLLLHSLLEDAREVLIGMVQDRSLNMALRCGMVLAVAHDMQRRIDHGAVFSCQEVLERSRKETVRKKLQEKIDRYLTDWDRRYCEEKQRVRNLYRLERLRCEWTSLLQESEILLFENGTAGYRQIHQEFSAWLAMEYPQWEIQWEQLLVYFLSTYFCGAVYDENVMGKAYLAVASVTVLYELLAARWLRNEKWLDTQEVIELVYRYSREIEHSDKNLDKIEKMNWYFERGLRS